VQPLTHIHGELKELAVAIELDRFSSGIEDDLAVKTSPQMILELLPQVVIKRAVQVI
jgi:hypothetical protein